MLIAAAGCCRLPPGAALPPRGAPLRPGPELGNSGLCPTQKQPCLPRPHPSQRTSQLSTLTGERQDLFGGPSEELASSGGAWPGGCLWPSRGHQAAREEGDLGVFILPRSWHGPCSDLQDPGGRCQPWKRRQEENVSFHRVQPPLPDRSTRGASAHCSSLLEEPVTLRGPGLACPPH